MQKGPYDDGRGRRDRYLPDGTKVDHYNNPIPSTPVAVDVKVPVREITIGTVIVTTAVVAYYVVRTAARFVLPWTNLVPAP